MTFTKFDKLFVYTDGGCRGNPGPGAIGIVIFNDKHEKILTCSKHIGKTTTNRAGYTAMITALELATRYCEGQVNCHCDSELIIKQAKGQYKVKNPELAKLFQILKEKETKFKKVTYTHVPRTNEYVNIADSILNKAMDSGKGISKESI